ncbi:MAG TPA: IS4 family transposase [Ktedonobacteraceae bacterium]|nr:IS4 family transposase [Ktedonobacteraceae bacterium]
MYDTASLQDPVTGASLPFIERLILEALPPEPCRDATAPRGRGRPPTLSLSHLWFGLILSVLLGMSSYQDLWRRLGSQVLGPFHPVQLSDDAIIARLLKAGLDPLQQIFTQLSAVLARRLGPGGAVPADLAGFATQIVALDETTWDQMQRHLPSQRALPDGHADLLPGKLAGRFNLRTQQWDFLQFREDASANCKWQCWTLLQDLAVDSLLLFDLGYFSFPWFDYLTQLHFWFICRLREKTVYQLQHVFYRHEGTLDALVWLGTAHSSRCAYPVRLVRWFDGSQLRCYVTNVLDPQVLPMADIARLYARRWDIELAFLTLKKHLGLHHWWSSRPVLMRQQMLAVLLAAQLLQALRVLIALQAGVDPFDVSLPLLVNYLPQWFGQGVDPVDWVQTYGKHLGFIRPSTRLQVQVPTIDPAHIQMPPPGLASSRKARSIEYVRTPGRPSQKKKRAATARKKPPSPAQTKPRSPGKKKPGASTEKKSPSSTQKKPGASTEKKLPSSTQKKSGASTEKKSPSSTQKKSGASTEKKSPSSTQKKSGASTEKKLPSSTQKKSGASTEKKLPSSTQKKQLSTSSPP